MSAVSTGRTGSHQEMSSPVLGMVLFVASEAMFFGAFFAAYFMISTNATTWPPSNVPSLKLDLASILTVILVSSSVTVQLSIRAIRSGEPAKARLWLGVTLALGITFLALQAYDYTQLGFGIGDGTFGTLFYVMTGIHMAHVIGGVVLLGLVFGQLARGDLTQERHDPLAAGAIYWDFVDVVWICLYTVFYLLTR